jgi:hypothetical protein
MTTTKINLAEKLALIGEHWKPKIVADLNDYELKVVKVLGEFTWHTHDDTDELFLVIRGRLTVRLRDGDVVLEPVQAPISRRQSLQRMGCPGGYSKSHSESNWKPSFLHTALDAALSPEGKAWT